MAGLVMAAIVGGMSGLTFAILADLGIMPSLLSYQMGGMVGLFTYGMWLSSEARVSS